MAEVILMPRLSDTMTEGVIAAWHKKVGDTVKKGELLAEIETDKATMELESYKEGTLLHIGGDKGAKINVDDLLAIVGSPGEDISQYLSKGSGAAPQKEKTNGQPQAEANAPASQPQPQTADSKPQTASVDISKMEEVVLMPRLSDTMTEGVIAAWHKKVGDTVKKGELLADIETDKATMELESYKNGKLLYQGAQQGEKIAVNDLLCIIGEEGKVDVDAIVAAAKGGGAVQTSESEVQSSEASSEPQTTNNQPQTGNGRVKASPLAKKLAQEKGIDLRQVQGSGDGGRIVKADVDNYKPSAQPAPQAEAPQQAKPQPQLQPVVSGEEGYTDQNVSQMRKVIAKRLGESKFTAPHFYLTMEIVMDNAMQARTQMNEVSDVKISFNDMVVKACAMALRKHPAVNSSWMGDFVRTYQHIHVGVAVAIEDGLIVPVIRFADQKTLSQIAAETKELAGKARNKKLQPNEFTGNTFTISNLGMMDIDEFTAIINPPDSAIMAVGRIKEEVYRKKVAGGDTNNGGDGFGVRNVMKVTLSCDHRSVDGAVGASFLQTFKKYLENPVTMLV